MSATTSDIFRVVSSETVDAGEDAEEEAYSDMVISMCAYTLKEKLVYVVISKMMQRFTTVGIHTAMKVT